jgi:PQQ-like domain
VPEVLIDLGEVRPVEVPATLPEPVRPATRRWWLFALALLPVLTTALSTRPHSAFWQVTAVPAGPGQVFAVTGDAIASLAEATAQRATVVSYPVAGGALRWRAVLPGPVSDLSPVAGSGVLVTRYVPGTIEILPDGSLRSSGPDPYVAALDLRTGRLLWTRPGAYVVDLRSDLHLAVLARGRPGLASQVFAIDLRSGRPAWAVPVPDPDPPWVLVAAAGETAGAGAGDAPRAGPPPRIAVLSGETVMLVDEATGAVAASAGVDIPSADARSDHRPPRLYLLGDQSIVAYEDQFHTVFAAYSLTSLAAEWRTTMPTETSFVARCGRLLCAGTGILATCFPVRCSEIDSFLYGLDPRTAKVRWVSRGWSRTGPALGDGARVIALNRERTGSLLARGAVIDPETGRQVLDLGGWFPVSPAPETLTSLVTLHNDALHSWFAAIRAAGTGLVPLGQLPVAGEACQSAPGYLVCPTVGQRLTVWRYQRP